MIKTHHIGIGIPFLDISMVTLCNVGCEESLFTKVKCIVTYRGRVVLTGHKYWCTGLWMIPLTPVASTSAHNAHTAHHMYQQEFVAATFSRDFAANIIPISNKVELVQYYHQCLYSPPKYTMLKALQKGWC